MQQPNFNLKGFAKLLLTLTALVALAAPLAKALLPGLSWAYLFLYCLAALAALFVLLVAVSICSLQFSQFILRLGGTDTQWFWFSGEPRGLAALRKGQQVDEDST